MIKTIKVAFLGLISLAFVGSAYADITFVSWGGAYTEMQRLGPASYAEKKTGIKLGLYLVYF